MLHIGATLEKAAVLHLTNKVKNVSEEEIKLSQDEAMVALGSLDKMVQGKGPYLFGENLSVADLFICAVVLPLFQSALGKDIQQNFQKLAEWAQNISNDKIVGSVFGKFFISESRSIFSHLTRVHG